MGKLPKGKVTLSVYVDPKCKEKLECLQQLYFVAGKRFSLSELVEDSVNSTYAGAYLSQESDFWMNQFLLNKAINNEAERKGLMDIMGIVKEKKAAAKEILKVPLDAPKEGVEFKFSKSFLKDLAKYIDVWRITKIEKS